MSIGTFGNIYSDELITATELNRQPGRVFPLKGKPYKGAWEYEVTKGDRVFYVPDEEQLKVVVYYAGKHSNPSPTP